MNVSQYSRCQKVRSAELRFGPVVLATETSRSEDRRSEMKPQAKREYLRDLVAEKNRWSRQLTAEERALGFLGWHERDYLPHCDFPNLVQFVTFRLANSMPETLRGEWEQLLKIEDDREKRAKLEEYLDRGVGECHLSDPRIAMMAETALLFEHNKSYQMLAWCVMPNHVHVLVHV